MIYKHILQFYVRLTITTYQMPLRKTGRPKTDDQKDKVITASTFIRMIEPGAIPQKGAIHFSPHSSASLEHRQTGECPPVRC